MISVQQALDQPGIGRYVMRILLGVDGGGQAVGYCGGQRGAQGLVVAQDGIADVQLGVQAVFRVIVKDAQIAGQGAAGFVLTADAQTLAVVLHADGVRQRPQAAGHAQFFQDQQQFAQRVLRRFGIGRVARCARRMQLNNAVRYYRVGLKAQLCPAISSARAASASSPFSSASASPGTTLCRSPTRMERTSPPFS